MGIRVPWKKAVTVSQIVQFVIDLFVVFFASYNYWAFNKWGMQKYTLGSCSGTEYAALSGMGVLSSYLVLFILCACPPSLAPCLVDRSRSLTLSNTPHTQSTRRLTCRRRENRPSRP